MSAISCAVDFCLSKSGTEAALHRFPRDAAQRQAWVNFVRATGRHYWTPSRYSVICSLHFDQSNYQCNPAYLASFGIRAKRFLRRGAVPTLYPAAAHCLLTAESGPTVTKRQCIAVGASGLPDSREHVFIDETLDFWSSSTALEIHDRAAPLLSAAEKTAPTRSDVQVQCKVRMALKSTQVAFMPKTKDVGVQAEHATQATASVIASSKRAVLHQVGPLNASAQVVTRKVRVPASQAHQRDKQHGAQKATRSGKT